MAEWFESFFDGLYAQALSSQFDECATLKSVKIVKQLLKLRKDQHVLDIACGMGRLTIPMARMGFIMTGVDLTASYIRQARRLARKEGFDVRFVQKDMREIAFDSEFDAAMSWFTSFGYFSEADNLGFCRRVLQALKPGGSFLVETQNKSWLLANFRAHSEKTIDGIQIVIRNRWDERSGRGISNWTFRKGRVTERCRSSIKLFNGAEIRSLLRAAGFRDIRLFSNPPVGRFTRHSQRLIAVGKRP